MTPGAALRATHLRRVLGKKDFLAVDDVSFDINAGEVFCILGPNGAGKTTTVKMCATLLSPTSGQIEIAGLDAVLQPAAAREQLGLVLGGEKGFYLRATARDNLLFFADVAKVPRKERKARVEEVLAAVELTERAGEKVQTFSRGMRQRLHIARSLLGNPRLLLLDEPTNGLDPEIALQMRKLIRTLADDGVAILLTTHYLAEAEALADHLLVLQKGLVRIDGLPRDIASAAGLDRVSTFSVGAGSEEVEGVLEELWAPGWWSTTSLHSRTYVQLMWPTEALEFAESAPPEAPGDLPAPDGAALLSRTRSYDAQRLAQVLAVLAQRCGEEPADLVTRKPSLEESYLALLETTGEAVPAA